MSLDGLHVNHAALDQAAHDLHDAVKAIDDRLHRLDGELAPLRSDWTGSAQAAYARAKADWDGAILEMRALLGDTSAAVHRANADYRAADRRGAASFDL